MINQMAQTITGSMALAETILDQLGGQRFIVMTGAKAFIAIESGLQFKLSSRLTQRGIDTVRITLTPKDDYNVEFGRVRKLVYSVIESVDGVYCDQLQEVFTNTTGLYTHL